MSSNPDKTSNNKNSDNGIENTGDTSMESPVVSSKSSSYNGSNPGELHGRADILQSRQVEMSVQNQNLESLRGVAAQYDHNRRSLTTENRITAEMVKSGIQDYDNTQTLTANLDRAILNNEQEISFLEAKVTYKRNKANALCSEDSSSSDEAVAPEGSAGSAEPSNIPENNQTPTEFVHELESCSPMEIIPDDD